MVQPVLTRWKYVGLASEMFLERMERYKNIAIKIKLKKSDINSKQYRVASDLLDLI